MQRLRVLTAALLALLLTGKAQNLSDYSGVVEIAKDGEGSAWRPADLGDTLGVRDSLRTFQGDLRLQLDNGLIRLSNNSELSRGLRTYTLTQGKAFVDAEGVLFDLNGPLKIDGQARLDTMADLGRRAVILKGEAQVTLGGRVLQLSSGQQIVLPLEGEATVSDYFERDPWYRDLLSLGEGVGRVIGFRGLAEIKTAEGWRAAELGMLFEQGDEARTAEDAWLELRFDDQNLVRLQADSEMVLTQLEDLDDGSRRTVLELRSGKVWAVVDSEGDPFEIETPGLVAGVRGTTFRVDAATVDDNALLKTFEGTVAGIVGFEVLEVAEGAQLEPETGVAPLELDELDLFNIERDKLVNPPELQLGALPSSTDEGSLLLTGTVEPASVVTSGMATSHTPTATFELEYPLKDGFNLIAVSAQQAEGAAVTRRYVPVIRTGYQVLLELTEVTQTEQQIFVRGLSSPGATIRVSANGRDFSTQAKITGRFYLALPRTVFEAEPTLSATLAGNSRSLPLPPLD